METKIEDVNKAKELATILVEFTSKCGWTKSSLDVYVGEKVYIVTIEEIQR